MARDEATRRSMQAALTALAETPIRQLEGKRLEAEDFDKLMVGDHPRDLLDIRTKANAPDTSVASTPKATDAKGQVSLIIPDDEQAGAAAVVVLLDDGGNVLNKQATTIGES